MTKRAFIASLLLMHSFAGMAQPNLTFTPEKPATGDAITITYTPPADLISTSSPIEGVAYLDGNNKRKAIDLVLTKTGDKYSATIPTDTSCNFIQLGFSAGDKFDTNSGGGYYIMLYDGKKVKEGSYKNLAEFYSFRGTQTGVERNSEKALQAYEDEFKLYPDKKRSLLRDYYNLLTSVKKSESIPVIKKEIEGIQSSGLMVEEDYQLIEELYKLAKLPEQAKLIAAQKQQKFPQGKWTVSDIIRRLYAEKDINKKLQLLEDLKKLISDYGGKITANPELLISQHTASIMKSYANAKQWTDFRKLATEIQDKSQLAVAYNSIAWNLQEKNHDLEIAEELSSFATQYAKNELTSPAQNKPDQITAKSWLSQREYRYATFADTYAMVLYRIGEYKKGFDYAQEAALTILKGKNPDQNITYTLLAEKVLPAQELKPQLEKFVSTGTAKQPVKDVLKNLYVQEKASDAGFDQYIATLEKELHLKMLEKIKESMINEKSPSFTLVDLDGEKIKTSELKGKVVVIDFWATWCGPCKASFPGMQKVVNKYKNNPDVKFLFINSWERGDDKEKNVQDFITSSKYTFQVLMDLDNEVIKEFKVEGIPAKFIIDKDGHIRFRSSGFGGSDEKLVAELSAMIELAATAKTL